jgi:hypothetical protein
MENACALARPPDTHKQTIASTSSTFDFGRGKKIFIWLKMKNAGRPHYDGNIGKASFNERPESNH